MALNLNQEYTLSTSFRIPVEINDTTLCVVIKIIAGKSTIRKTIKR